jgi:hypothetical protein
VTTTRVEDAYEAIRAHHHQHPYTYTPGRVYQDHGWLSSLLAALGHLTEDMAAAADRAAGSDDGLLVDRQADVAEQLTAARAHLAAARDAVDKAHNHVGHLIFTGAR